MSEENFSPRASPPTYGDIPLCAYLASATSGIAFALQSPPRAWLSASVGYWQAEARPGRSLVVIRGGQESTYLDVCERGQEAAQRALDIWATKDSEYLQMRVHDDEHIAWWVEDNCLIGRIVVLLKPFAIRMTADATVTDSSGQIQPSTYSPPVAWNESMRYYRLSQTTDDLFDAYRNAFLALESVLSYVDAPRRNDGEKRWLMRALNRVSDRVQLSGFAPSGKTDIPLAIYEQLCRDTRAELSHAKHNLPTLVPQDARERDRVVANLQKVVALYCAIVAEYLDIRIQGTATYDAGFDMAARPILNSLELYISPDEINLHQSDLSPRLGGRQVGPLRAEGAPRLKKPFEMMKRWSADRSLLASIPCISSIMGTEAGDLVLGALLPGRLTTSSFERCDVAVVVRASNNTQARRHYGT